MEQALSFDQLPAAVNQLTKTLENIERLLLEKNEQGQTDKPDELLTIKEAAEVLNLKVCTIYSKVSKGELPVMKRSKHLYFSRIELLEYIKKGRKKSNADIEAEANAFLMENKKGGRK